MKDPFTFSFAEPEEVMAQEVVPFGEAQTQFTEENGDFFSERTIDFDAYRIAKANQEEVEMVRDRLRSRGPSMERRAQAEEYNDHMTTQSLQEAMEGKDASRFKKYEVKPENVVEQKLADVSAEKVKARQQPLVAAAANEGEDPSEIIRGQGVMTDFLVRQNRIKALIQEAQAMYDQQSGVTTAWNFAASFVPLRDSLNLTNAANVESNDAFLLGEGIANQQAHLFAATMDDFESGIKQAREALSHDPMLLIRWGQQMLEQSKDSRVFDNAMDVVDVADSTLAAAQLTKGAAKAAARRSRGRVTQQALKDQQEVIRNNADDVTNATDPADPSDTVAQVLDNVEKVAKDVPDFSQGWNFYSRLSDSAVNPNELSQVLPTLFSHLASFTTPGDTLAPLSGHYQHLPAIAARLQSSTLNMLQLELPSIVGKSARSAAVDQAFDEIRRALPASETGDLLGVNWVTPDKGEYSNLTGLRATFGHRGKPFDTEADAAKWMEGRLGTHRIDQLPDGGYVVTRPYTIDETTGRWGKGLVEDAPTREVAFEEITKWLLSTDASSMPRELVGSLKLYASDVNLMNKMIEETFESTIGKLKDKSDFQAVLLEMSRHPITDADGELLYRGIRFDTPSQFVEYFKRKVGRTPNADEMTAYMGYEHARDIGLFMLNKQILSERMGKGIKPHAVNFPDAYGLAGHNSFPIRNIQDITHKFDIEGKVYREAEEGVAALQAPTDNPRVLVMYADSTGNPTMRVVARDDLTPEEWGSRMGGGNMFFELDSHGTKVLVDSVGKKGREKAVRAVLNKIREDFTARRAVEGMMPEGTTQSVDTYVRQTMEAEMPKDILQGSRPSFVLVRDNVAKKVDPVGTRLSMDQVSRHPGAHRVYTEQDHLTAVPSYEWKTLNGKKVMEYMGDFNFFGARVGGATQKMADHINEIRNIVLERARSMGREIKPGQSNRHNISAAFDSAKNDLLPILSQIPGTSFDSLKKIYVENQADILSTVVSRKKGTRTIDMEEHKNWRDRFGPDVETRLEDRPINAAIGDPYARKQSADEVPTIDTTAINPSTKDGLMDPLNALHEVMDGVSNSYVFEALQMQFVNRWAAEFGHLYEGGAQAIARDGIRAVWDAKPTPNAAPKLLQQAERQRSILREFLKQPSAWEKAVDHTKDIILEDMYKRMGFRESEKIRTVAEYATDFIKDPASYVRAMAFTQLMGFWNPKQLFMQANSLVNMAGHVGPRIALQGGSGMVGIALLNGTMDPARIRYVANNVMTKGAPGFKWNPDEFVEMYEAMQASGWRIVGHNVATRDQAQKLVTGRSTIRKIWDTNTWFFEKGEQGNRFAAYAAAYRRWRKDNPKAVFDKEARTKVFLDADDFAGNMTSYSNAKWQRGYGSIVTQFWGYSMRISEQIIVPQRLGGRFDPKTRARLAATYSLAYGVPVGTLGATMPFTPAYDKFQEYWYNKTGGKSDLVSTAWTEGAMGAVTYLMTGGEGTNISERFGLGSNPIFDALDDPNTEFLEIAAGVSGSKVFDLLNSLDKSSKFAWGYLTGEPIDMDLRDFTGLFTDTISTLSGAEKAFLGMQAGIKYTRKGSIVTKDYTPSEAIVEFLTGVHSREHTNAYKEFEKKGKLREMQKKTMTLVQEQWRRAALNRDNPELYQKYAKRAWYLADLGRLTPIQRKQAMKFGLSTKGHVANAETSRQKDKFIENLTEELEVFTTNMNKGQ